MKKETLQKTYNKEQHFHIPCFVEGNPKLSKMLTGEGAQYAKETYPEYISVETELDNDDRFHVFKIAHKINENAGVDFFTCVALGDMTRLRVEAWVSDELMTAAGLIGENGTMMLGFLTNEQR